jgi:hypothetical protein
MALNIPDYTHVGEGLLRGLDTGSQLMQRLMENRLNQAKAQESNMFANLLNIMQQGTNTGSNVNGITPTDQNNINNMKPGESYTIGNNPPSQPVAPSQPQNDIRNKAARLYAALKGIHMPEETVEGYHYVTNPLTGETTKEKRGSTLAEKAELETQTARKNAFSKEDAKIASTYDEQAISADETLNTLGKIGETIKSPQWAQMRALSSIPGGGKVSLWWYAHNGTPDQQKMAGGFITNTGQIVANMASQFKGQFRKGEQTLINGIKINESDTPASAQGKYDALISMENFMKQRGTLMSKLIRQGLSPADAHDEADKILKGALVRNIISLKSGVKISNKEAIENANNDQAAYDASHNVNTNPQMNLEQMAKDAIAQGADPKAVEAELKRLKGGM